MPHINVGGLEILKIQESEIRSNLAEHIAHLDPMLTVIKEEHYIGFDDGRKAFIDILAKDKFGCYTVIELKKSNKSARTTIQQLLKYTSFLKEKYQLENSQIRCIAVSTHWDELRSPFSEFKKFSDYEVKGYSLEYSEGKPPILNEVDPDFIVGDNKPLSSFFCFKFETKEIRDRNIEIFESVLRRAKSLNYVTFPLHVFEGMETPAEPYCMDEYPYAFAWVVFHGDIGKLSSEISEFEVDSSELGFLAMWENSYELSKLRTKIVAEYLESSENIGFFKGYAIHTLNNLFTICDFDDSILYRGSMFEDGIYSEGEIIDMCNGINGLHPYIYISKTTPMRIVNYNTTRQDIDKFLVHNQKWNKAINDILFTLDEKDFIEFEVYNPLNVLGFINDLCVEGKSERLPYAVVRVTRESGRVDNYYGLLLCEEETSPPSPLEAILKSYPDKDTFRSRSVINTITEYDEKLSSLLGLSYGFIHENESKVFSPDKGLWLDSDLENVNTMNHFVHSNIEFVREVGNLYKKWEIGVGNGTNMVVINKA